LCSEKPLNRAEPARRGYASTGATRPGSAQVSRPHVFTSSHPTPHVPAPELRSDQVTCIKGREFIGARRACGAVASTRDQKVMAPSRSLFRLLPAGFEAARLSKVGRKIFFVATARPSLTCVHEVSKKHAQPARPSSLTRDWGFSSRFDRRLRNGCCPTCANRREIAGHERKGMRDDRRGDDRVTR
jgi:hypothetical protein